MLRLSLGCLLLACVLGCADRKGPPILVQVAPESAGGKCVGASDQPVSSFGISHLRVSVRVHGERDTKGLFLCDRVVTTAAESFIKLIPMGGQTVDLLAEGFQDLGNGSFKRVATGSLFGVGITSESVVPLRLFRTEGFGCMNNKLNRARAFHSATRLPTGHVLIVGGAVASATDAAKEELDTDRLFLTGGAELWDPYDGKFYDVSEAMPPSLRAFHNAVLLSGPDSQPPYRVLLAGGVTTTDATKPALRATTGFPSGARLFVFDGTPLGALPTKGAPSEIITIDPVARSASRAAVGGIPSTAYQATTPIEGGMAITGGISWAAGGADDTSMANQAAVFVDGTAPRTGTLAAGRLGATLTHVFGTTALLWGGGIKDPAALPMDPAGELLNGIGATGNITTMPVTTAIGPMTHFHTATAFSRGANSAGVLVTGGFVVNPSGTPQPPAPAAAVRAINVNTTMVTASPITFDGYSTPDTCLGADRYRSAGWESALALSNGKVLVTGGAPRSGAGVCNDCEDGTGLLCSTRQASLFTPSSMAFSRIRRLDGGPGGALQIGRLGHSTTELRDGTVLIVGGITTPSGPAPNPRTTGEAEIYNPRRQTPPMPDSDDPIAADLVNGLTRSPGDVAKNNGEPAASCPDL
jgi:hypothetical protein